MRQNKIRIVAYVESNLYVQLVQYGEKNHCRNMTGVIEEIFFDWQQLSMTMARIMDAKEKDQNKKLV